MFNRFCLFCLVFIPATLIARVLGAPETVIFFLSSLAIVPLAKYIGDATEELAGRTNSTLGGFLNATFGNATELIIGVMGIRAGLPEVVKASITGSILGNLLLVLGVSIVAGGIRKKHQTFNKVSAKAGASTLLLGAGALIIPAVFLALSPVQGGKFIEEYSIVVSALMIIAYVGSLVFALITHTHLNGEPNYQHIPKWTLRKSIVVLVLSTAAVGVMSELLVGSIEPIVARLGWSELFIGVVFIAFIGNAAEHSSAMVMAMKNKMEVSVQIAIGSATQIIMFVAPLLVLVSLMFPERMSLVFNPFELIAMVLSIWLAKAVIEDGETHWFEGVQLLTLYGILAVGFYFYR